jgi:hypothetical protein
MITYLGCINLGCKGVKVGFKSGGLNLGCGTYCAPQKFLSFGAHLLQELDVLAHL